jgi:hypothetical protein
VCVHAALASLCLCCCGSTFFGSVFCFLFVKVLLFQPPPPPLQWWSVVLCRRRSFVVCLFGLAVSFVCVCRSSVICFLFATFVFVLLYVFYFGVPPIYHHFYDGFSGGCAD